MYIKYIFLIQCTVQFLVFLSHGIYLTCVLKNVWRWQFSQKVPPPVPTSPRCAHHPGWQICQFEDWYSVCWCFNYKRQGTKWLSGANGELWEMMALAWVWFLTDRLTGFTASSSEIHTTFCIPVHVSGQGFWALSL